MSSTEDMDESRVYRVRACRALYTGSVLRSAHEFDEGLRKVLVGRDYGYFGCRTVASDGSTIYVVLFHFRARKDIPNTTAVLGLEGDRARVSLDRLVNRGEWAGEFLQREMKEMKREFVDSTGTDWFGDADIWKREWKGAKKGRVIEPRYWAQGQHWERTAMEAAREVVRRHDGGGNRKGNKRKSDRETVGRGEVISKGEEEDWVSMTTVFKATTGAWKQRRCFVERRSSI